MSFLNTLTFTNILQLKPSLFQRKRASLLRNLKDQLILINTPDLTKPRTKRVNTEGHKHSVVIQTPVRPWWRETIDGKIAFFVKCGLKKLEFEKGQTAILVPDMKSLPAIIQGLIVAVENGELDSLIGGKDELKGVIKRRVAQND